jgi:hypothetical protein
MKKTQYFKFRRKFSDRIEIQDDWIERVMRDPIRREIQIDGRIRIWGRIKEAGGKYLRVVVLEDGETVHNAFFDRKFKE